jgi:hypothetical protein
MLWSIGLQNRVLVWNSNLKPEEGSGMFRLSVGTYLPDCVTAQNTTRVFIRQPFQARVQLEEYSFISYLTVNTVRQPY